MKVFEQENDNQNFLVMWLWIRREETPSKAVGESEVMRAWVREDSGHGEDGSAA